MSELQDVLDKLELTFSIIPNVKLEAAAEEMVRLPQKGDQLQQQGDDKTPYQPKRQQLQHKRWHQHKNHKRREHPS